MKGCERVSNMGSADSCPAEVDWRVIQNANGDVVWWKINPLDLASPEDVGRGSVASGI
jgi:hypothetical protein